MRNLQNVVYLDYLYVEISLLHLQSAIWGNNFSDFLWSLICPFQGCPTTPSFFREQGVEIGNSLFP